MGFWSAVSTAVIGLLQAVSQKEVCYHEAGIGCFNNRPPFHNTQKMLPESPARMQVEFLLYTRQNRTNPQLLTRSPSSIRSSHFKGSRNTKFIIHGYNDDGRNEWVKDMGKAILNKEDANVIAVNWEAGADKTDYRQAAANARVVGAMIAEVMKSLRRVSNASYRRMHLIGHSLGAHVAGYAGERAPGIGRITGLDPAGPLFENEDPKVRLDPGDAKFVDVIHTDGDSLLELGFGLETPIGHADFYPNGGTDQPGCTDSVYKHLTTLLSGTFKALKRSVACSHKRVLQLFTESINTTCRFQAYPCSSVEDFKASRCEWCRSGCATMGYNADELKYGTFYLTTASSLPFCRS